jgi:predicted metal-binding membrane protein
MTTRAALRFAAVALVLTAIAWVVTVLVARSMGGGLFGMNGVSMGMAGRDMSGMTAEQMAAMGMSPATATATDLAVFLGAWLVMMAAMMIPSALPMLMLHARAARNRLHTVLFGSGYFLVWTGFGLVAYVVYALLRGRFVDMGEVGMFGRPAAAAALIASGVYQVLPFKEACLRHCRSPIAFVMHHWRAGARGALRMGAAHGLFCVGCCVGLMLVLLALGTMNLALMILISLVILGEKLLPWQRQLTWGSAAVLVALGVAIAFSGHLYGVLT